MNLAALLAQFRVDAEDEADGNLFSDAKVKGWLNEAEEEAALRANLIHDSSTAAVCQIAVTAGTSVYSLHTAIFNVTYVTFTPTGATDPIELEITDRIETDRVRRDWRTLTEEPRSVIVEDTTLRLTCIPDTDGTINLEAYRAPLTLMVDDADSPEIGRAHHRHLVQWALHRAFSIPDAETFDPNRAEKAEIEFTKVFGIRPDAELRKGTQANRPQVNKAIW